MSHTAPGAPALGIATHAHHSSTVTLPLEIMQAATNDVARAWMSLNALAELFRSGSLGNEEACLPHLLSYIVENLQRCNENVGQYLVKRADGGDHA